MEWVLKYIYWNNFYLYIQNINHIISQYTVHQHLYNEMDEALFYSSLTKIKDIMSKMFWVLLENMKRFLKLFDYSNMYYQTNAEYSYLTKQYR